MAGITRCRMPQSTPPWGWCEVVDPGGGWRDACWMFRARDIQAKERGSTTSLSLSLSLSLLRKQTQVSNNERGGKEGKEERGRSIVPSLSLSPSLSSSFHSTFVTIFILPLPLSLTHTFTPRLSVHLSHLTPEYYNRNKTRLRKRNSHSEFPCSPKTRILSDVECCGNMPGLHTYDNDNNNDNNN